MKSRSFSFVFLIGVFTFFGLFVAFMDISGNVLDKIVDGLADLFLVSSLFFLFLSFIFWVFDD